METNKKVKATKIKIIHEDSDGKFKGELTCIVPDYVFTHISNDIVDWKKNWLVTHEEHQQFIEASKHFQKQ